MRMPPKRETHGGSIDRDYCWWITDIDVMLAGWLCDALCIYAKANNNIPQISLLLFFFFVAHLLIDPSAL